MPSQGIQLLGSGLALLGWVGVLLSCIVPMWRVTSFMGATIITSEIMWEGIWMTCVVQSTGQMQCDPYDSMLALSSDLKAAQVLTVGSLLTGSLGLMLAFIGGKCTHFLDYSGVAKGRVATAAGVALIISALLCVIPVTWAAIAVIQIFYNPQIIDAQRREIGSSIYIGWGASILLLLGGGMLCSTSCSQKAEDGSPLVDYRVVCSSDGRSSIRSSRQVRVHRPSQNRKTLARSESSDGTPVDQQQHKTASEGSKKSKAMTEKSMVESGQSNRLSTKSQLNHTGSDHSLESSESEAASTCPEKTYI